MGGRKPPQFFFCPTMPNVSMLLLASFAAPAEVMTGKVVRIVDGNTLVFLDLTNTHHKVRLAGIDTPERKQPFGKRATENLAFLAGNKPARLEWDKIDRYKRIIGRYGCSHQTAAHAP
jgi:endonuclease YncB( thermonuclease family)